MIDIQNMSVLIVDDMENMSKSIRGMMKVLNYGKKFKFASNGREAWSMLQKGPTDILITDWNMPVMTGVELLELIREDRRLRDMPVIMITAEANREIVAEAAEADIDSYLLKPLTVKTLGDRVATIVEKANNPPPMVKHLRQAVLYEEEGDIDSAIQEAGKAMAADKFSSRPVRELGYFYFKKGDFQSAEKCYIRAAKMNKLDVIAFHRLGELYLQKDDVENAIKFLDRAMSISPRHVSRGISFGKILAQKGMKEKAVRVFRKVINLSDDPIALREEIAGFCMENQMDRYAADLLAFIVDQIPSRHDLILKIGQIYERIHDNEKAIQYLMQAETVMQDDVDIKISLAKIYMMMGQMFRAETKLREVLKLDARNAEARELLRQNL